MTSKTPGALRFPPFGVFAHPLPAEDSALSRQPQLNYINQAELLCLQMDGKGLWGWEEMKPPAHETQKPP